ncbi:hypothetical protein ADK76_27290 [Streptomyces griseoflavus]|nr:hypothetical protein ADK76_27290 [Streptomyces griseoflavus]
MTSAPASAPAETAVPPSPSATMQVAAAALAPEVMPMTSGLASGLRTRLWKIAPDMPNPRPASSPVSTRGSRMSRTNNWLFQSARPVIAPITSGSGTTKSPTTSRATAVSSTARASTTTTGRARRRRTTPPRTLLVRTVTAVTAPPPSGCAPWR